MPCINLKIVNHFRVELPYKLCENDREMAEAIEASMCATRVQADSPVCSRRVLGRLGALAVALLALTAPSAPIRAQAAPGTFVQQLGPYRFELPPGYVFRSYRAGPDEPGGAFAFLSLLPDLEPRTKTNEKAFEVLGFGDKIYIWVSWRSPENSGARLRALLEERISRSQWFPPVREGGFTRYRIEGGAYFQLYLSDTDPDMFFKCMDPQPGRSPACSRTEELAPDLIVSFDYSYNYRFQTPEISARIRRLLLDNMRVVEPSIKN